MDFWRNVVSNVTRFGEFFPLWQFCKGLFIFGKILNQLWQPIHDFGNFSLFQMAKYWTNNIGIWSHWLWAPNGQMIKSRSHWSVLRNKLMCVREAIYHETSYYCTEQNAPMWTQLNTLVNGHDQGLSARDITDISAPPFTLSLATLIGMYTYLNIYKF